MRSRGTQRDTYKDRGREPYTERERDSHRNRDRERDSHRDRSRGRRDSGKERHIRHRSVSKPYSSSSSEQSFRFDSPPRESARIANLHGLEGGPLQGLRAMKTAELAQKSFHSEQSKLAKEIYVGNVPPNMPISVLIGRLNEMLVSLGASTMAGSPIVSGWLGGEGQFAFLELRTAQEANNALSLNGHSLEGSVLKVGRPRGGAIADGSGVPLSGVATVFALDESVGIASAQPALEESLRTELLALVGAPTRASMEELEMIVSKFGAIKDAVLCKSCLLFRFEEVADQRKCAYDATSSGELRFDRDFPLALVRVDEAIAAGYLDMLDEQLSGGIRRGEHMRGSVSRIVWMTNFPPISNEDEFEAELTSECRKFGNVGSVHLVRVAKERITVDHGYTSSAESLELVAVVAFDNVRSAVKCRKYLTGGSCFFMAEKQFEEKTFDRFQPAQEIFVERQDEATEERPLEIRRGKIISRQEAIIAANKKRKHIVVAPEDREILD